MIVLGIDSGTQSTKTVALDFESGELLASASHGHQLIGDLPPGHLEQQPEDWIEAVEATVRSCLEKLGKRRRDIAAIGVSGQQHGFVAVDKKNRPIRAAKLWCDTSTTEECKEFEAEFGGAEGLIELAGNAILPGYTAPKILWLKKHEPTNYKALDAVLLPHDFINFYLTGERTMEFGDASGTGLLDVRTRQWCKPLVDFVDPKLHEHLPQVTSSRRALGLVRDSLRETWGLPNAPVVSAGGGDNMMGAIGTGNVQPGTVTASLGTSGTVYAFSTEAVIDPQGEVAAFCDSTDRWLPLVCTMNVTVATEQVRKLFNWTHEQMEEQVAGASPGAGGLLFLPYLTGERTPNLPRGSGVLHGLNTENMAPGSIARATMEGVTLGLGYGLGRLRELGIKADEVRLTGGGSNSAVWRQICADIFNVPTVCLKSSEGAALGAAIQGAYAWHIANGRQTTFREMCQRLVQLDSSTRCEPIPNHREVYERLLNRQGDLARRLHLANYL